MQVLFNWQRSASGYFIADGDGNPITEKFIGAMNYRCIFPIQIRKNLLNADSPFTLQSEHKRTTIQGMFSFLRAGIAAPKHTPQGITYDPQSGEPNDDRDRFGSGGGSS